MISQTIFAQGMFVMMLNSIATTAMHEAMAVVQAAIAKGRILLSTMVPMSARRLSIASLDPVCFNSFDVAAI